MGKKPKLILFENVLNSHLKIINRLQAWSPFSTLLKAHTLSPTVFFLLLYTPATFTDLLCYAFYAFYAFYALYFNSSDKIIKQTKAVQEKKTVIKIYVPFQT